MYHSITFGNKNTWDDWFLIPSSRPVFNPPEAKTMFLEVPGADGVLDLSTVLTGDIHYGSRTGSLEFIVDNGHKEWFELYSDISDYLHGQKMKAILEDDPSYYYEGRFTVNEWKSDKSHSLITIDYVVDPYKIELFSGVEDWLWDSFNFETGIIREYKNLVVNGTLKFYMEGSRKPIVPSFVVASTDTKGLTVTYNGTTYSLKDGENRVINIKMGSGTHLLTFKGNGNVSINYRGGRL